ncbi:unnamed protein product, partial [Ixodes hexagonus]
VQSEPDSTAGSSSGSSSGSVYSTTSSSYEETTFVRSGSIQPPPVLPEPVLPAPQVVPQVSAEIRDKPSRLTPGYPVSTPPSAFDEESSIPVGPPRCLVCRDRRREISVQKRTLFEMWFVCLMTLAALVIPAGLVLAPYLGYYFPTVVIEGPPSLTTPSPWLGIPESCLAQVNLSDNVHNLRVADASSAPPNTKVMALFCLYNNSRFRKAQRWDYLPKHIPYQLCPNVVYWSMGVRDGKVISRVPQFDVRYGIWTLRATVEKYRPHTASSILMALGGYPEDSAHFSRLGRDPALMSKLAANIVKKLVRHKLNGITIHWRDMQGTCGSPDDFATLLDFVQLVRELYVLNGYTFIITVITPPYTSFEIRSNKKVLDGFDFVFHETYRMNDDDVYSWCQLNQRNVTGVFDAIRRNAPALSAKLCHTISLGLLTSDYNSSQQLMTLVTPKPMSNISQVPGVAAVFELCAAGMGVLSSYENCVLVTYDLGSTARPLVPPHSIQRVYAAELLQSIRLKLSGRPSCVLVVDLDFDLYRGTCPVGIFSHYSQLWKVWQAI